MKTYVGFKCSVRAVSPPRINPYAQWRSEIGHLRLLVYLTGSGIWIQTATFSATTERVCEIMLLCNFIILLCLHLILHFLILENVKDQRNCKWNREPKFAPAALVYSWGAWLALSKRRMRRKRGSTSNSIQKGQGTVCLHSALGKGMVAQ